MKHLFITLLFLLACAAQTFATTWYVKTNGNDNNSGLSWNQALQRLHNAITLAEPGDEIWVAAGTYIPTAARVGLNEREKTFFIGKDIKIYGGFPAAGGTWNERDWNANPTILSGDVGMPGTFSDNAYNVVSIENRSTDMWLDGFTIRDGNASGSAPYNKGGGIYNYGEFAGNSTPTIQHCKIINNAATAMGGGIYNDGYDGGEVSMHLTDCLFSNNTALAGGALYNDSKEGGYASPYLTDCDFTNNTATYGGALYNRSSNFGHASPVLKDCTFTDNSVASMDSYERIGGGAIYNEAAFMTEASPSFTNCTFTNNTATGRKGGAIYNEAIGGTTSPALITCTFSGSTAAKGGCIYSYAAESAVASVGAYNCIFSDNTATQGGVAYSVTFTGSATNPIFTGSLFFNNSATERGGVLAWNDSHAGTAYFNNCTFSKNTAPQGGVIGIVTWNNLHKSPRLFNCIAWGNSSTFSQTAGGQGTIDIQYSLIQEATCPTGATCNPEVIYNQNPLFVNAAANNFHLQNGSPAQNKANAYAPLFDLDGDARPQGPAADMGYDEVLFACPAGPVVYVDKDAVSGANNGTSWANAYTNLQDALDAANCPNLTEIWVAEGTYFPTSTHQGNTDRHKTFFINHDIKIFGGFAGTEMMRSQRNWNTHVTTLSGDIGMPNQQSDNVYHVVWIEGRSSAMELDGFVITKAQLMPQDPIASFGGGIYNNGEYLNSTPVIRNCTITANEGSTFTRGAGMVNKGYYGIASPTLSDCTFSNNRVYDGSDGGGIANYAFGMGGVASPVLHNCTFINNQAATEGGGFYSKTENSGISDPVLTNCTFTGNQATTQRGGAIYQNGKTLILTNCTFNGNSAVDGAAVYLLTGSITGTDCDFTGNTSSAAGGALKILGINATISLTRCLFSNNTAGAEGGAVYIVPYFNNTLICTFNGCTFSGNTGKNGGGLFVAGGDNSNLLLTLNNCRLFNNSATERGGAVCMGDGTGAGAPKCYNCTFYNNTATLSGGAFGTSAYYAGQGAPLLVNCIVWGNSSVFGQTAGMQGNINIQYSLIQGPSCPPGATCASVIYNQDPLFVNAAGSNFHLMACSPAVNTGTLAGAPGVDFDGISRPQNGAMDMGAFEYQGAVYVPSFQISGRIIWKQDNTTGVKDATVALTGDQTGSAISATNGTYSLTVTSGTNFTITPGKIINKMNGINASDAARITQHLSGMPITDPWQLIAADVNGNNQISPIDANIIQQSLLGNPSAQAQFISSWRFIPKSYVLNNPPWGFPEKITLTGVSGNQTNKDFYGVKVGDLTAPYANPANFGPGEALVLHTTDRKLEAGTTITVDFTADALSDLTAMQFAMQFDPTQLQWIGTESLDALPLTADNFGTFQIAEGNLKCVWSGDATTELGEAARVFRLTFQVLQSGNMLSDVLQLDENELPAHVYNSQFAEADVRLHFFEGTSAVTPGLQPQAVTLLQNQPNPFVGQTTIGFVLPAPCSAQLRIIDAAGRIVTERTGAYTEGLHYEVVELTDVSGVLYYELNTPWGHLVKKMVVAK